MATQLQVRGQGTDKYERHREWGDRGHGGQGFRGDWEESMSEIDLLAQGPGLRAAGG